MYYGLTMPPRTASGMEVMMPAILLKTPIKINQMPLVMPALLAAHLVRAITPLFWLNVVLGMDVKSPERIEQTASDVRPP